MAIYLVNRQSKNQRFQELNNKGTFAAKRISEINFPISFLNFLLFSFEFFSRHFVFNQLGLCFYLG